jgi:hypothetical protein
MVYQCHRCFYYCKNKKDMKKHLGRKNECVRNVDSYYYSDVQIQELSFKNKQEKDLIYVETKDETDLVDDKWEYSENSFNQLVLSYKKNNKKICCFCKKEFFRKYELLRHLEKKQCGILKEKTQNSTVQNTYIEKNIEQNIENQQINNQQINNININVYNNSNIIDSEAKKILKNFNEEWDISKIDIQKKLLLLLSDNKYSNTMEEILKNDKNMNVLLDENNQSGIVFQENKFMNVDNDEIIVSTMYKLYNHLLKFYSDIKDDDDNLVNKDLKKHKDNIQEKYNDFNKSKITKELVKNILIDIFHTKKEEIIEKFMEFNKFLSIDEENNKIGF